jgi:hypothetical protein
MQPLFIVIVDELSLHLNYQSKVTTKLSLSLLKRNIMDPIIDLVENRRRMERGEMHYSFASDLVEDRRQCKEATDNFNSAGSGPRRKLVELWKK